ncbi:YitT family protein [Planococcus salinus]|uniref:YitT family protein n=1 Tax=Planococcus salinus TaxID=1848460 RepID=A0A3M8P2X7_9BACL|nr:YitT family protein [Planococcus salinus]RNF38099.1 YitT family protein [Planococcus salinus]
MMAKQHKKEPRLHFILRFIFILVGAAMAAASIELFLVPNSIIDGGIIGVSLILDYLTVVPFGILLVAINLPFLFSGYKYIGRNFFISSIFAIVALAILEIPLHSIEPFVDDPLLATVFGGLLLGAGVGIVIRNGGALDGTEILGILLTRKLPFSVGEFVMFFNVFIFGWAGFVLGWEQAMYSILTYYIASKTIDIVIQGLEDTKAVIIITDDYEELGQAINDRLGRSVTKLHGKGGFNHTEKDVIYVVVTRLEITKLKQIVNDIDSTAFTTIMNTQEVHGGTFKSPIH